MTKLYWEQPAIDLSSLSITDLWCIMDLYERLSETALNQMNQPRFMGEARDHAEALWDDCFNRARDMLATEMRSRVPSCTLETEQRAEALIRHMALTRDDFPAIAVLATGVADALAQEETKRKEAA